MTPQGGAAPPIEVYMGLGGNLGDRRANLAKALDMLSLNVDVARVSSLYETEPVGYAAQPAFLNAVALVRTTLPPRQVFSFVKGIERAMGRTPSFRNAPRLVDIDILLYGEAVMESPYLTVPHPRMHERAFVLAPLAEIAPEAWHPALLKTARELLAQVFGREGVRLVASGAWWERQSGP